MRVSHHERWDGTGYEGLAWNDIPISGRIVAVADAFDAMTHERPYSEAVPVEAARAEIASGAGSQFDPVISEVFQTLRIDVDARSLAPAGPGS